MIYEKAQRQAQGCNRFTGCYNRLREFAMAARGSGVAAKHYLRNRLNGLCNRLRATAILGAAHTCMNEGLLSHSPLLAHSEHFSCIADGHSTQGEASQHSNRGAARGAKPAGHSMWGIACGAQYVEQSQWAKPAGRSMWGTACGAKPMGAASKAQQAGHNKQDPSPHLCACFSPTLCISISSSNHLSDAPTPPPSNLQISLLPFFPMLHIPYSSISS